MCRLLFTTCVTEATTQLTGSLAACTQCTLQCVSPVIRALIKATIVLFRRDNYTFTKPLPRDPFVLECKKLR